MRKLGHIGASPELVRGMFCHLSRWTAWMPGVQSVSLLEEEEGHAVALIRQRWMGRAMNQKWEFRFGSASLDQVQLEGFFKKWETHWRFLESPNGEGTTLIAEADFDLGLFGRLMPRRVLQDTFDRMFEEVMDKARARAHAILSEETLSAPAAAQELPLLEIHESDRGLEVRMGGRRYRIEAVRD